jgi:aromatic-ring opening dioxygenase LigAB LigA subunit
MSAYQVNKLCHRLYHDRSLRDAVKANPAKAIADWPLSDAARNALLTGDVRQLYESGVHPFLLGHITRWDLFGVTAATYAERIKDAKDPN